jgi:hypothetical protein
MYDLQGPTKENILTSPFENIHFSCTNQHSTRSNYAQITNQNSYAPTNIEQESHIIQFHQQTIVIQELTFKCRTFEAVVAQDGQSLFK